MVAERCGVREAVRVVVSRFCHYRFVPLSPLLSALQQLFSRLRAAAVVAECGAEQLELTYRRLHGEVIILLAFPPRHPSLCERISITQLT